jgi:cysteine desulfurase family protein (TIGR01976 family)
MSPSDPSRPALDPERLRELFPGLSRTVGGRPAAFLDGPAGSQLPRPVIEAMAGHLERGGANTGGAFVTSRETDALLDAARRAAADLVGTTDPRPIAFGPNMTTLTFALARALGRTWRPGDEVVVTQLEHDANYTPWILAAKEAGATVRAAGIRPADCTLDLDELAQQLGPRTRLVAVGCASNAVGTLNPVREIVSRAHAVGAEVFLDAVHHAPHALLDVEGWDCDYLACSAYKFFGPHVGILWGRRERLASLPVDKLRPSPDGPGERFMPGTANHEGIAGVVAAIDYIAGLGGPGPTGRRAALRAAFAAIGTHERALARRLLEGLARLPEVRLHGIADPERVGERCPTFAFTHARRRPREIAEHLGARGVFVWDGNFYAQPLTEALGLEPDGMVRAGFLHYNTADEVDRLLEELARL